MPSYFYGFFQSVRATNSSRISCNLLKPPFGLPRQAGSLFAALHVHTVRFTNLRYFFSQLCDAFFDRILHDNRLAGHAGRGVPTAL